MHTTLHPDVKGHIDVIGDYIEGWCFHTLQGVLPLRVKINNNYVDLTQQTRDDVCDFYKNTFLNCGWKLVVIGGKCNLEMYIDSNWVIVMEINTNMIVKYNKRMPSFTVVDDFYAEPDTIRAFALKQTFLENTNYHKGKRAIDATFRFPGLKEQFELILGKPIKNWDTYEVNGCFQYCIAEDKAVYHCDYQTYAGIIYLTPDAAPQAGTSFYRSKSTKQMKSTNTEIVFKNGYYDSTQFDLVDTVGNVYNRLILFDAKLIHAAPIYFGNELQNARLFQLFFFDI